MRKGIFALAIFGMLAFTAQADINEFRSGLNPTMSRFLDGCLLLKHGVEHHNEIEVGVAVDSLNRDSFTPNAIKLSQWNVTPVDTASVIPSDGAFHFSDAFGRAWIESNGVGPFVEAPSVVRDSNFGLKRKCNTLEVRLSPHSSATYTARLRGVCNLFMINEPSTKATLKLESEVTAIQPEEVADDNLWIANWTMPTRDIVKITITNNSDIASTIMLATD
jgi:hypothetical protein